MHIFLHTVTYKSLLVYCYNNYDINEIMKINLATGSSSIINLKNSR